MAFTAITSDKDVNTLGVTVQRHVYVVRDNGETVHFYQSTGGWTVEILPPIPATG